MVKKKKTVLFVEDENDLVDLYHLIFDDHGYNFLSTYKFDEIKMFCERGEVDLILLDILLPTKSGNIEKLGFTYLKDLKANPKTKDIPVIILTNLSKIADKKKGMKLGAEDFIIKTEKDPPDVFKVVEEVFSSR